MAAVTNVVPPRVNVSGSYRQYFYKINIATSGDTLTVPGLHLIKSITFNNTGAVTNAADSGNVITFTTTGAVSNLRVNVEGN